MSEEYENPSAYISKRWTDIYDKLCKGDSIFQQMTNLFTLSASIGYQINKPKKPENAKGIFKWISLNSDSDIPILMAIAWASENRNFAVLSNKKRIIEIASEYAECGMIYLNDNLFEDYMQEGQFIISNKLNIEFDLAQIIEGIRQNQSLF